MARSRPRWVAGEASRRSTFSSINQRGRCSISERIQVDRHQSTPFCRQPAGVAQGAGHGESWQGKPPTSRSTSGMSWCSPMAMSAVTCPSGPKRSTYTWGGMLALAGRFPLVAEHDLEPSADARPGPTGTRPHRRRARPRAGCSRGLLAGGHGAKIGLG